MAQPFVNPGAMATGAIFEILQQQEMKKQQELQNRLLMERESRAAAQHQSEQDAVQRQQAAMGRAFAPLKPGVFDPTGQMRPPQNGELSAKPFAVPMTAAPDAGAPPGIVAAPPPTPPETMRGRFQDPAMLRDAMEAGLSPQALAGVMDIAEPQQAERKLHNIPRGAIAIDPNTEEVVAEGLEPERAEPSWQSGAAINPKTGRPEQYRRHPTTGETQWLGIAPIPSGSGAGAAPLPEDQRQAALRTAARQYLQTGKLPPLGMGQAAASMRMDILAEVDRIVSTSGGVINPQANEQLLFADRTAMTNLNRSLSGIRAYKETAKKNIDVLLAEAEKVPQLGMPIANRVGRALALALGGDDQAAYNAALGAIQPEIARILFNPNLVGVLTDSARHEAQALLRGDFTMDQLKSAIRIVETDMDAREKAMVEELSTIDGRIRDRDPYRQMNPNAAPTPGVIEQQAPQQNADPLGLFN